MPSINHRNYCYHPRRASQWRKWTQGILRLTSFLLVGYILIKYLMMLVGG